LKEINLISFLGELSIEFQRSKITYKEYIDNGNKFIYARILKESNTNIRNNLLKNSFLLSEELQEDALALISHYDIWIEKWSDLYLKNTNLKLDDVFIFQNKHTFPKQSELNLLNKFKKIKKEQ
jgi:hypothetical protein